MSVIIPSVLAGVGVVVTAVCTVLGARAFGNARLLAEAAPTAANALDEGLHEVAGRLVAEGEILAPLTGRPAVFYRLLLEQRRRNRWETVLDQRDGVPSAVEDDTGRVALLLANADVVVSAADRIRTGIYTVPSAELDTLLARVATPIVAPAGPFLRWREEILLPGDRVFAVGNAQPEPDAEGPPVWALHAQEGAPLLVSDREEAEVVRHQRRAGQRWAAFALLGAAAAALGGWGLLPLL
jgi:hypothetical protein